MQRKSAIVKKTIQTQSDKLIQTQEVEKSKQSISMSSKSPSLQNPSPTSPILQILFHSSWPAIIGFIFGGCCSNVFTLESLVSQQPDSGYLLTATQFLFVAIEGYFQFFDFSRGFQHGFLAKRNVPIYKWFLPVCLFFMVSTLNNYVWIYRISVPVHIIFRSGGTVFTMVAGAVFGRKKYSWQQVLSVMVLTIGVVVATLASNPGSGSKGSKSASNNNNNNNNKTSEEPTSSLDFAIGVGILAVAAILSAVQGLVAEQIYVQYGKHWRESLFYTHLLSMPFFVLFRKDISRQLEQVMSSSRVDWSNSYLINNHLLKRLPLPSSTFSPPSLLVLLLANALTQYFCIRGVNNLAGNSTALTVSFVLNIRKFVSLILSIYLFGNHLSVGTVVGTLFVFMGAGMYSYSSSSSGGRNGNSRPVSEQKTK